MISGPMRIILLVLLFLYAPLALAHEPVFPQPESSRTTLPLEERQVSQAYYGTLTGVPHTYTFTVSEDEPFHLQLLLPDTKNILDEQYEPKAILVKRTTRGVREIFRLSAGESDWPSFYEFWAGDRYLRGPEKDLTLDAGEYILEISTADNYAKYVMVVGSEERISLHYFKTVAGVYKVKQFFGKPAVTVLQSPIVLVPLLLIIIVGFWYWRKEKHA